MKQINDQALITSREELEKYFKLYYKRLFLYARKLVHEEAVAEEVVADAFIQLWKLRDKLAGHKNIEAYLFVTVRNKSFNHLRTVKRYKKHQLRLLYNEDERLREWAVDEDEIYSGVLTMIKERIKTLSPRQQEVMQMYFERGMTTQEIAATLAITTQTVLNLKNNSLRQLRDTIKNHPHLLILFSLLSDYILYQCEGPGYHLLISLIYQE